MGETQPTHSLQLSVEYVTAERIARSASPRKVQQLVLLLRNGSDQNPVREVLLGSSFSQLFYFLIIHAREESSRNIQSSDSGQGCV